MAGLYDFLTPELKAELADAYQDAFDLWVSWADTWEAYGATIDLYWR